MNARHWQIGTAVLVLALLAGTGTAVAQTSVSLPTISVGVEDAAEPSKIAMTLQILALMTVLSLAPALLILTTSFTRIAVVLGFLRTALGTQQLPPNQVLIGLSVFLTFFVMAPTWKNVHEQAIRPWMDGELAGDIAFERATTDLKGFMLANTRAEDLNLFLELRGGDAPEAPEDAGLDVVIPGFVVSELRTSFQMGFVIYIPFLIIDMVVASVLMSMGMLMLPPVLISLPFKILLFVLVDGWHLVVRSLAGSFVS
ncbi:MAG: flagellar type III secretion system pore protein FliP [Gemmatimonadetes bacterium]|nr:flagellar type III secretion system pore protein FliP [Gemmatimonadota bacterium]